MNEKLKDIEKYVEKHETITMVPDLEVFIDIVKLSRWNKRISNNSVYYGKWGDYFVKLSSNKILTISKQDF